MIFLRDFKQKKFLKISLLSIFISSLLILIVSTTLLTKPKHASADDVDDLMRQVSQAEQLYDKALSEQIAAEAKYNEAEETIAYAEERIPQLQALIGQRAKELYINRAGGLLFMLLDSSSLSDVVTILDYVNKINEKDAALIAECSNLRAQAEQAEADIWPSLEAARESAAEAAGIMASVQGAIAALQAQNIPVVPDPGGGGGGGGGGDTPTPGPSPDPGPVPYGDDIVSRALACLGKPYGWACAGPDAFDCSGLVSFAYTNQFVHWYSTYSIRDEAGNGINGWWRTDYPSNGTCCCSIEHCGIYYNGMMIHAPQPGDVVKIGPIQGDMLFYNR